MWVATKRNDCSNESIIHHLRRGEFFYGSIDLFMKKTFLKLTALLGLFLLPFTAFAEEPIQSLNKMSQAMRDLNYEIAFVQTTPTNMDSFRYRHI